LTLTRKDRLQALGLWPTWRLRTPAPAEIEPASFKPEDEPPRSATHEPEVIAKPAAQAVTTLAQSLAQNPVKVMGWDSLNAAIKSCTRCELAKTRTQAVPGVGDIHAEWLFVGEAPGANEDRAGEPFVGDAGKLLDAMMLAIGLKRGENVFIANVLKSRPPGNRDPQPDEVAACLPYLEHQIELIQPKLIVALGRFAAQNLLATDTPIGKLRGQVHQYRGVPLVVTYHPAYLLRNPLDKAKVWEDLVLARDTINELKN
jgi:DNA polymerase